MVTGMALSMIETDFAAPKNLAETTDQPVSRLVSRRRLTALPMPPPLAMPQSGP